MLPLLGFSGAAASFAGAVVLAVIAHAGKHAPMPPAEDWRAIGDRLLAGEIMAVTAWGFYKLGSNRIVLRATSMEIVTWGLRWFVDRAEVADVVQFPASLTIILTDGSRIRPSMFWSSGPGMIYFQLGLFRNAMSRETIRHRILAWRQDPAGQARSRPRGIRVRLRCRRWRVRADLWLLLGLAAAIAIEAAAVTAWW